MNQREPRVADQQVVVGLAPDLGQARRVFGYLQNHGIDPNDVRLELAAVEPDAQPSLDPAVRDQLGQVTIGHAGRRAEAGALIGALAGGAVGALGGVLATSGHVGRDLTTFLAIVFVFTGLGAWAAACLTAARSMADDNAPARPSEHIDGSTWIAVRVHDARDVAHARDLLEREGVVLVEEDTAHAQGAHSLRW